MEKDRALYVGPSHAEGGIPVVVDEVRPVEVEGQEYKICGEAYRSNEILSYEQKTNIEILDDIHKNFACKFDQNKASGSDFIVCKLVIRDLTKRNRKGTVKQILDEMQGEKGCKLSDGSLPQPKLEEGGNVGKEPVGKEPLYLALEEPKHQMGYLTGNLTNFANKVVVLDLFPTKEADIYQVSGIAQSAESIRKICALAVTLPGANMQELQALAENDGRLFLDLCNIDSLILAGKILGYSGVAVHIDLPFPTALVVWNYSQLTPIVIFNKHNYELFGKPNSLQLETGGEIKGYAARVKENLLAMGSSSEEWTAVPVTSTAEIEVNGKTKQMPVFSFPKEYTAAPTKYPSSNDPMNCELCGKAPISTMYWIQNDTKKWIMGVGSECITHFQQESGADMLRAAKIAEAHLFIRMLKRICLMIQENGASGRPAETLISLKSAKYYNWRDLYNSDKKRVSLYIYFKDLYPFDYEKELAYCLGIPRRIPRQEVVAPSDASLACRNYVEKNMLAWYTRNKKKKIALLEVLSDQLLNFTENMVGYFNDESLRNLSSPSFLKMYELLSAELRKLKQDE